MRGHWEHAAASVPAWRDRPFGGPRFLRLRGQIRGSGRSSPAGACPPGRPHAGAHHVDGGSRIRHGSVRRDGAGGFLPRAPHGRGISSMRSTRSPASRASACFPGCARHPGFPTQGCWMSWCAWPWSVTRYVERCATRNESLRGSSSAARLFGDAHQGMTGRRGSRPRLDRTATFL